MILDSHACALGYLFICKIVENLSCIGKWPDESNIPYRKEDLKWLVTGPYCSLTESFDGKSNVIIVLTLKSA